MAPVAPEPIVANVPRDADDALRAAEVLVDAGRPVDGIRLLMVANRNARATRIEERLVSLRHAAFDSVDHPLPSVIPPAVRATGVATGDGLHAVDPDELSPATLRDGLARQGCVFVPQLIPSARAAALARGIDQALAGFDESGSGPSASTSPWYVPFTPAAGRYRVGGRRNWVRASGAVWTADSPRMLFELCALAEDTGIGALVADYLGERPALSANKCTLRRVPVDTATNWHQDGAFLGADVRTLNLWLVLSDCGADSPGLEIVPRRFDEVLETGTDGAMFDWSVSPTFVDELAEATPVLRPQFRAGDALLFDHLFLHRTAAGPGMTRERYAMETWFFAPSGYPDGQIPLVY